MPTRRRAREVAFQLLYEFDFGVERTDEERNKFLKSRMGGHKKLMAFSESLFQGTREHTPEIDQLLTGLSANWALNRMAAIDRSILRLGCFEILHSDAPGQVVINEALEIAKRYGGKNSRQFINGILDRVFANRKVSETQ